MSLATLLQIGVGNLLASLLLPCAAWAQHAVPVQPGGDVVQAPRTPSLALGANPTCFVATAELLARDGAESDAFGNSVSLSGETALIGARGDDDGGISSGSAYVYSRGQTGWIWQAKLTAGDADAGDRFGTSVSLNGDTAVVGARFANVGGDWTGAAYVFVRDAAEWSRQAKLLPANGVTESDFGWAVAVNGDTLLVAAPLDGQQGVRAGAVYVFVREGASWVQQAKLLASDGAPEDRFGWSVSSHDDTALVGVLGDSVGGSGSGSAYVFVREETSWSQQAKLVADDGAQADHFGRAVSLYGNTALVGAPDDNNPGPDAGSAYVFVREGTSWAQQAKLSANAPNMFDQFGWSVSIHDGIALMGAPGLDEGGVNAGAAYVFVRDGSSWRQQSKLLAEKTATLDRFGYSVSATGYTMLVGSPFDDDGADTTGSAHTFSFPTQAGVVYCTCPVGPCGNSDPEAGCINSSGSGALLTGHGATSPDELSLFASGAPPGEAAILFQGDDAVSPPFGDGFLCAGGGLIRITPAVVEINADGTVVYGPCSGDEPISSVTGVVPGSGVTKRYQLWFSDPGGPCQTGFSLSNGYQITW